jgi:tetratricopeptide (TPR) repeat protein
MAHSEDGITNQTYISANNGNVKAMTLIAKSCKRKKDYRNAIKWYSKIVTSLKSNHDQYWQVAVNDLGTIMFDLKEFEQARNFFEQGANAHNSSSTYNLGILAEMQGRNSDALYWYDLAHRRGHKSAIRKYNSLKLRIQPEGATQKPSDSQTSNNGSEKSRGPRPRERLIRNWEEAEKISRDWMRYFGFVDAVCNSKKGPDGGVDIRSSRAIAQVKFHGAKTPRTELQLLHSNMKIEGKIGLFFSLSGYRQPAIDFANAQSIAIFQFDLQGVPQPMNSHARRIAQ